MILTSAIIHVFELLTLLLAIRLGYQLAKCYREFEAEAARRKAAYVPAEAADEAIELRRPEKSAAASDVADFTQTKVQRQAEPQSGAAAILNDYIGEFFNNDVELDIQPYKSIPDDAAESEESLSEAEIPQLTDPIKLEPVFSKESQSDDDPIIMVAENKETRTRPENVMSDKVVHAMLHEAKVVCSG